MSTGRRLAKRSILGTRISAPGQDGRYYSGIIQATKTSEGEGSENVYSVLFDNKLVKELKESEIIGPGFQNVSSIKLKAGQKVFITHNGREVCGSVVYHWPSIDEVQIRVPLPNNTNETVDVKKKLEEIRLLESRKSARLHDQDQDYSRLADIGPLLETRKRPTSHVIDVPTAQK